MHTRYKKKKPMWKEIDFKVKGGVGVVVSELPLAVPRYSFRVGAAKMDPHTDEMHLTPFLTLHNAQDASALLQEVSAEYVEKRDARIKEVERKRQQWEENNK